MPPLLTDRRRKLLVVGLTAAQLLAVAFVLPAWVERWQRLGWTGLSFVAMPRFDDGERSEVLEEMLLSGEGPGRVLLVTPGSPADRAGLRIADVLHTIDGRAVTDLEALTAMALGKRTGDAVTYAWQRGGERGETTVVLAPPLESTTHVVGLAVGLLVAGAFLAISLLVFWAKPRSSSALLFYLLCTVGAVSFFLATLGEPDMIHLRGLTPMGTGAGSLAAYLGAVLLTVLLANLLLHFALVFPRRRPWLRRHPQAVVWLHALPFWPAVALATLAAGLRWPGAAPVAALATLASVIVLGRRMATRGAGLGVPWRAPWIVLGASWTLVLALAPLGRRLPDPATVFGLVGVATMFYLVAASIGYSVITCVVLIRSYRGAGVEERYQLRWPVWGTTLALALSTVLLLAAIAVSKLSPESVGRWPELYVVLLQATKLAYLPIPVSFAFGILKYRLLDIDVVLRKTLVYAGVTGFVVAGYFLLAGGLGLVLVSLVEVESQVSTVIATLLVAAALVPVRNRLQRFVDRRFRRPESEYPQVLAAVRRDATSADLESLAPSLAERLQRAFDARSVAVFTRSGDSLSARAKIGLRDEVLDLRLDPSAPPLDSTLQVLRPQVDELPRPRRRDWQRLGAERLAVARRHGEVVGLISVGRRLSGDDYGPREDDLLRELADQLSLAFAEQRGRRRDGEMRQAFEIQRALLPSRLPRVVGFDLAATWLPAREVSGDYYDVLTLDGGGEGGNDDAGGAFAVCIGDVSGKGMPAALLMSSLQAAVRATADAGAAPQRVVRRVRDVVSPNLSGGKFVTFFYARVERADGRVAYLNAGHNPPILARADGRVERLERGGPALARLFAGAGLEAGETSLDPGDRLVLFTDGVSEAQGPDGEQLGEQRLVAAVRDGRHLGAEALAAELVQRARRFAGGEAVDDLTLVVVARDGRGSSDTAPFAPEHEEMR